MTLVRRLLPSLYLRLAALVLLGVLFVALCGRFIVPHDPLAQDAAHAFANPSTTHPLGLDYLGRDTFSRLLAGSTDSVLSAVAAVLIGLVGGALPGMASVFLGRSAEYVLMRIVDALLTIPPIIFAIAIIGGFGNGLVPAVVAIGVLMMPRFFRVIRAATLGLVRAQYVEAATLLGASRTHIMRRHIWRKIVPTVIVTATSALASSVLAISALGFLGLGVVAPAPSWGSMLSDDLMYVYQAPYAAIWPGLAIVLTVWSLNALADGVPGPDRRRAAAIVPEEESHVLGEGLTPRVAVAQHG
jgi:peptide/nickel transport system permease protein